jgi:hypothetical protein
VIRARSLIHEKILDEKTATLKSEGIAKCKEVPAIPVNGVVDKKRTIGKRWRYTRGR